MTATRKHSLHFNHGLSKHTSYPRFSVVSENKTRKPPSFFKQKCIRKGCFHTTLADVNFTTEGWGSIHIMNLYKMQSCCVGIPTLAYVGSFVSLSFCLKEIVLKLGLLYLYNQINWMQKQGRDADLKMRLVKISLRAKGVSLRLYEIKIHLIPMSQIILYQSHIFILSTLWQQ
jgi:hypothetical protein